jgi:hypothetical protein
MRVIHKTPGIRTLKALLLAVPVLAALQVQFQANLEFWRVPAAATLRAFLLGLPVLFFFSSLLSRASRWLSPTWRIFLVSWFGFLLVESLVEGKIPLAFFALLIGLLGHLWDSGAGRELSKSYIDSGLRWYESSPPGIAGLSCTVNGVAMSVARLDLDGAFLFSKSTALRAVDKEAPARWQLSFHRESDGKVVNVLGELVRAVHPRRRDIQRVPRDFQGVGIRFIEKDLDRLKDLGDFIEQLRGGGHAS